MGIRTVDSATLASARAGLTIAFWGRGRRAKGAVLLGPTVSKEFSPQDTALVFASHDLPAPEVLRLLVLKDPGQGRVLSENGLNGLSNPVPALNAQQKFRHRVHPPEGHGRIGQDNSLREGIEQGFDLISIEDFLHQGFSLLETNASNGVLPFPSLLFHVTFFLFISPKAVHGFPIETTRGFVLTMLNNFPADGNSGKEGKRREGTG